MHELAKKTTAALTECVEAIGKGSSVAKEQLELQKMAALTEILKTIPEKYLVNVKEEQKSPADSGEMARAYCALEKAAIDLHREQPLFFAFAEMQEWNETYRRELIMGLILALDLFRQNGVPVEQTVLLEKVRHAYTSEQ